MWFIRLRCRDAPDAGKAKGFPAGHRDRSLYALGLLKWGAAPAPATPREPQDFALPAGKIQVLNAYRLSCKIYIKMVDTFL